jgi:hypothetical protein
MPSHPESRAYIKFVEETGVECIATYMRWAYFRKKSADEPFDIYSDIDSKIAHYKRINYLWNAMAMAELAAGVLNIGVGIVNILFESKISYVNLILGSAVTVLGILFIILGSPLRKKIRKLKHEKMVRE